MIQYGETNRVGLWDRSEPQDQPFVGQALCGSIENIFWGGCADLRREGLVESCCLKFIPVSSTVF